MSGNGDIEAARDYHRATSHSEQSLRADRHYLDFDNQPVPFKIYRSLEVLPLPTDPSAAAVLPSGDGDSEHVPTRAALARLLNLTAGVLRRKRYAGGEVYFRAYANTGALYHIDLYLICCALPDLEAGVYHFAPHDFALRRLRSGDHRAVLADATGRDARVVEAPALLVSASTYWRNSWKYRDRAYRHCFWDAGTMHANLLAVAADQGLDPRVLVGFADEPVERLVGLDRRREGALTIVALGRTAGVAPESPTLPELSSQFLETLPLSHHEIDYPRIRVMHEASSLESGSQARDWRLRAAPDRPARAATGAPIALEAAEPPTQSDLEQAIRRRGSTRSFDRDFSLSLAQLSMLLRSAAAPLPADFLADPSAALVDLYVIVHAVAGLAPGAYYYRGGEHALELLRQGDLRAAAGRLALFQDLAADAAVNVYALADLDRVLAAFGNRGYRAAQLEGGIRGGRIYYAAYAQHFGATGLTFLDDEVTTFFSPHAAGKSVMFLVACGRSIRHKHRAGEPGCN